jgi:hypothetical protein
MNKSENQSFKHCPRQRASKLNTIDPHESRDYIVSFIWKKFGDFRRIDQRAIVRKDKIGKLHATREAS